MQDRMTEDKPTRVPARANRWWNQPSAIGLGGTEGLTGVLGDRAKSVLLLERAPTDWKAGCGRSARPVWEGGGAHRAPPILIGAGRFALVELYDTRGILEHAVVEGVIKAVTVRDLTWTWV